LRLWQDADMDADRLAKIPLFEELDHHDLSIVARWADQIDVPAGTNLIQEGRFPHEFFVIEEGSAEVTHEGARLAELGPGDFFGEIALVEHLRRTATVTTTSPTRLVVMHARDFGAMEEKMPEIAAQIRSVMKERRGRNEHQVPES
jgi:CRP-like cAMP-binding protein